jgi:DDE family transposase
MSKKKRKTKASKGKKATKGSKKATYRVRNWSAYNKSLVQRGSITVWISEDTLENWHPKVEGKRQRGGQMTYSDQSIECLLMLKAVYHLPYRQTVGFAQSMMDLLGAGVRVPNYTTLCKRSADLTIAIATSNLNEPKHIVMDSTGLKIYGEGEWKVRQHGYSKRRTWRKLHLSVDANSHEIEAVVLSEASLDDAEAGKQLLLETSGKIKQIDADGSYDRRKFYKASQARGVKHIIIPPRRDAKIWQHGNSQKAPLPRDQNLRRIRRVGRKKWKQEAGYHRRSLVETAIFRFKIIFGNTLSTRTLPRQVTEARVKVVALNRMTKLGMPDSYRLA